MKTKASLLAKQICHTAIPFMLFFTIVLIGLNALHAKSYSTNDYKTAAEKYLQGSEIAGAPITLRYNSSFYHYIPFKINKTLASFPGVILDNEAKIVTDSTVLTELYRYPGLIKEFAHSVSSFDEIASRKVAALARYCRTLEVQKTRFDEINRQGNTVGVLYYGIKLAANAVTLVKTSVAGLIALAKDLAKGVVQDTILSYLLPTDSQEILTVAQSAFDASTKAYEACIAARNEWNSSISTTGKADPTNAAKATEDLYKMFYNESAAMRNLKTALERINSYPQIITKITERKFQNGTKGLDRLVNALTNEANYWNQTNTDANDENNLSLWANEQISRAQEGMTTPITGCQPVNLSEDYNLYTYTVNIPGTNGPCSTFANSVTADQVTLSCATDNRFRNHWVKKIDIQSLNKIKIKADLTIDDNGFFYSECPSGGVKYDDYSRLVVLSTDPTPSLDTECNKVVLESEWPKCSIEVASNPALIGLCGVPKCSTSRQCEFNVDTTGLNEVYLTFHTSNPWPTHIEGTLSNLEVCPAE